MNMESCDVIRSAPGVAHSLCRRALRLLAMHGEGPVIPLLFIRHYKGRTKGLLWSNGRQWRIVEQGSSAPSDKLDIARIFLWFSTEVHHGESPFMGGVR